MTDQEQGRLTPAQIEHVDHSIVEIVEAIQSAVSWGMAHREDAGALDKTVADCKEMIDQVMDASVLKW
jgi:hypothetical protein